MKAKRKNILPSIPIKKAIEQTRAFKQVNVIIGVAFGLEIILLLLAWDGLSRSPVNLDLTLYILQFTVYLCI